MPARRITVSKQTQRWFDQNRVFFSDRLDVHRLKVGDILTVPNDVEIEPYVGFLVGKTLFGLRAFSYTYSSLPPRLQTGRYCSIAAGVTVPRPRHPVHAASTSPCLYDAAFAPVAARFADTSPASGFGESMHNPQPVLPAIGHDVWIGAGAVLLPGVSIATGAVVAAHAVVTRDVAGYTVVAGNPARKVRDRVDPDIAERLVDLEWWRFAPEQLGDLDVNDPRRFADGLAERWHDLRPFRPSLIDSAAIPGQGA